MGAIVEAIDLVVGNAASPPFSLGVGTGEIVGLLFPPAKSHTPILRALAGLDATVAGEVRFPGRGRIVLATPGSPLSDALSARPDLVLLDTLDKGADHSTWVRIATERARGTSFVVATESADQAARSDRVSLASWETDELTVAMQELARQMTSHVQEFLAVLGEARHRRTSSLAVELRRLNAVARALNGEVRRYTRAKAGQSASEAAEERFASVSVGDGVLDAVIDGAHER